MYLFKIISDTLQVELNYSANITIKNFVYKDSKIESIKLLDLDLASV